MTHRLFLTVILVTAPIVGLFPGTTLAQDPVPQDTPSTVWPSWLFGGEAALTETCDESGPVPEAGCGGIVGDRFIDNYLHLYVDGSVPLSGQGNQFFDVGVRTGAGMFLPWCEPSVTSGGATRQWVGYVGFDFGHWDGNAETTLNDGANNFIVNSARAYVGELGLGMLHARHFDANRYWIHGVVVKSRAGNMYADIKPTAFNPQQPVVNLPEGLTDDAMVFGYRIEVITGIQHRNGWQVGLNAGFGHDWTNLILDAGHSTGSFFVGGYIMFPFGN